MRPPFKIGVDGGGTKTECILVDATGTVLARQLAPGCNPSVVGPEQARLIVTDALCALREQIRRVDTPSFDIAETHLFMAGASGFWREFAASLTDFGRTRSEADSLPALELATGGGPGLVLHAGTGSFVAARAPDGSLHYAGGLGWRLGDAGGGYDLGWTGSGQWFRYTVDVASAGTYTVGLRVAAPSAVSGALHLSDASGASLSGAVSIPATGGWQNWATVSAAVTLPAGRQVLTLDQDSGGWNLNQLAFAASGTDLEARDRGARSGFAAGRGADAQSRREQAPAEAGRHAAAPGAEPDPAAAGALSRPGPRSGSATAGALTICQSRRAA